MHGHPFQVLRCSVSLSVELQPQESDGVSPHSLVFAVLQAHSVGWKQNAGKVCVALLLRNERSRSSLEIVKPGFQGHDGTNFVTPRLCHPAF